MTEQHPLTDSKALSLFSFEELMDGSQPITIEDAMRKAADWQLEQVLNWSYKYLYPDQVNALSEAMRPQQNEEQALKALDKLYQENDNGMKELANESND